MQFYSSDSEAIKISSFSVSEDVESCCVMCWCQCQGTEIRGGHSPLIGDCESIVMLGSTPSNSREKPGVK